MSKRLVIEASIIYNKDTKYIKDTLSSLFINGVSYFEFLLKNGGVYFIKNKLNGKYYVGSTVNFYYRHISLHISTSYRPHIYRYHDHRFLNEDNLNEFEVIFLLSGTDNLRIKEERYIRLLKSYELEYGYNLTKKGTRGAPVRNKNIQDKVWVTNCEGVNYCINNNEPIPNGFYPGRLNKSNVKLFFDWYDPNLANRTPDSEELTINLPRNSIYKYKSGFNNWRSSSMHIYKMINNLKKYYNITLIFK